MPAKSGIQPRASSPSVARRFRHQDFSRCGRREGHIWRGHRGVARRPVPQGFRPCTSFTRILEPGQAHNGRVYTGARGPRSRRQARGKNTRLVTSTSHAATQNYLCPHGFISRGLPGVTSFRVEIGGKWHPDSRTRFFSTCMTVDGDLRRAAAPAPALNQARLRLQRRGACSIVLAQSGTLTPSMSVAQGGRARGRGFFPRLSRTTTLRWEWLRESLVQDLPRRASRPAKGALADFAALIPASPNALLAPRSSA